MTSIEVLNKAAEIRAEYARRRIPVRTAAAGIDDVRAAITNHEPIVATRKFKAEGINYEPGDKFPAEEMTGNVQVMAERGYIVSLKTHENNQSYRALQALVREMNEPEQQLTGAVSTRHRAEQALALAQMAVIACSNDLDTALSQEARSAEKLSVVLGDTP